MAQIITIRVLCDAVNEADVLDGINEMMRTAQILIDSDNDDERSWIVDYELGNVIPVSEEINDAICNDTYSEGDGFV